MTIVMDHQFCVDVPRIVFFVNSEWVPSSDPKEVWERLLLEYDGDVTVATAAAECFKQQFLSDYYINELHDINFYTGDDRENLLSYRLYRITLNTTTGHLTVEKDFIRTVIVDGESYDIDYCLLTVVYDPFCQLEVNSRWMYTIDSMRNGRKSIILTNNLSDL